MPDHRSSIRSALVDSVRRLVAGATDRRFDAVEQELARVLVRIAEADRAVTRTETEIAVLREQAEETVAYLRVQHGILRDLLEELRPVLGRQSGPR